MIGSIKKLLKDLINYDVFMESRWLKSNQFHGTEQEWEYTADAQKPYLGLLYDVAQEHQYYMVACKNMGLNYKVLDIRVSNWINLIKESGCETLMVWPTIYKPIQKQFWDERLRIISEQLKLRLFPSLDLLWLYESKRKSRDWLLSHNYAHPQTEVFFTASEATEFINQTKYPVVLKTDQGASSSGVFIIRSKDQANRMVRKAFKKGIRLKNRGINDRHQGYVLFQEYLPNCEELRIIRVAESYFCRLKKKKGDFHSGSGDIVWAKPPEELLEQTRQISSKFDTPNINVDYFETEDGHFVINEIHALWGGRVIKDENLEGRYLYDENNKSWRFENGDFFGNRCAELRLEWLIKNQWV
jgi:hypothetical protein